jgi:lipid-A-disaccharide synthase
LKRAAEILSSNRDLSFILPASPVCGAAFFEAPLAGSRIRAIEGEAWDALAHCDVAIAASGTVTVEAALLGAPMVTFYRVTPLSWAVGKLLVDVPFYSMVNLIAEKKIVPELMQSEMRAERLAEEARRVLDDAQYRGTMKDELARVAAKLRCEGDPIARAAQEIEQVLAVD